VGQILLTSIALLNNYKSVSAYPVEYTPLLYNDNTACLVLQIFKFW